MPIYSTRNFLIDPSTISMMEQAKQNRIANYNQTIDQMNKGTREMLGGLAQHAGQGVVKAQRRSALDDQWNTSPMVTNSPEYRAAAQHFYETGDASQLNQLKMAYEAQQARIAEAKAKEEEQKKADEMHRLIRVENARPVYDKLLTDYYNATDEEQVSLDNKLKALETEFPELGASEEREKIYEARMGRLRDEAEKKAAQDKFNEESHSQRIWYETNVIPTLKDKTQKGEALQQIQRLNITPEDRKALEDAVRGEQTIGEQMKKGAEATTVDIAKKKQVKSAENKEKQETLTKAKGDVETLEFEGRSATDRKIEELKGKYPDINFRLKKVGNKYKIEVVEG